jgi:hypothetical protein
MYIVNPGAVIAINATNAELIWEYEREYPKEMADFVGGPSGRAAKVSRSTRTRAAWSLSFVLEGLVAVLFFATQFRVC